MKPWLRLPLALIGLALVCLFLSLNQPVGLNHPVAGSKPWLASWREPAPGPPIASIYPSTKLDPVRARPLPCLVGDCLWTTSELGPPGLPTPGPPEPNEPWRVPIKAASSKHAIQPPFSTKFPPRPIEFEELGFCNSL
jgi:hypothetical protein